MSGLADLVAADLRAARCCDALDPCEGCKAAARMVARERRLERASLLTLEQQLVTRAAVPR